MVKRLALPVLLSLLLVTATWSTLVESDWPQWAQNSQHTGMVQVFGQVPKQQLAQIVYDPFVKQEQAEQGGELVVHYQVPLVACRRVTITRLLASKLSWPLAAKSCSPSNSILT